MFKGNTKLELNEETIIVALQEYFDKRVADGCSPVVKGVKASSDGYGGATFAVDLAEPESKGAA